MIDGAAFECRCGTTLEARAPTVVEAAVLRWSACGAVARGQDDDCSYCGSEIVRAGLVREHGEQGVRSAEQT